MADPFSPFKPPAAPPGIGGITPTSDEGDSGDGGAEAAGDDESGGAGDAGAAGASSDDAADETETESAEATEGAEGFVTETDFVTTESIGTGSGAPGTGESAGEGYIAPVQYVQTYRITNSGGSQARIRSFRFNTPDGIQHVADLTNFGGTSNFSSQDFVSNILINSGSTLTFDVGYNYLYGGLGTRTGTIVVYGSAGTILRVNITLIIGQTGSTAGGAAVIGGSGTGGGGSGGGYVPPAGGLESQGVFDTGQVISGGVNWLDLIQVSGL